MKSDIKKYILILLFPIFVVGCTIEEQLFYTSADEELPAILSQTAYQNTEEIIEETTNFPLYAMIKSEDIYLYGIKPYGMVLYYKGKGTYFDWPGLTPRLVLPEMIYHDFDGDGKKDLAVLLYVGSGTGIAMMDLHILVIEEREPEIDSFGNIITFDWIKPTYTVYSLLAENIDEWMTEHTTATLSENHKSFDMDFYGNNYTVNFVIDEISGAFLGVRYDSCIVKFDFAGNNIQATIPVGISYEKRVSLEYFGDIKADVIFDGERITLANYTFSLYDTYK
jgi:hypothetical protein